ncbi:MAG: cobyrinic acid a c-diamide synthase [Anaerolineaceae bacterium]|nr:MAG: cobyrinic acid a c-diamide synthase [Anaerolineaceae bacterium]
MGKIISIHSFRGGTGKSNITANLAAQAALQGKRVAVVDTDIQSPGIHVLFGLDETKMGHTLNEFLRGECTIKEVAHPAGAEGREGVQQLTRHTIWLVPSSINGKEISRVVKTGYSVDVLNRGLNALQKELNLDYLFIDTHPGLNEETLLSVALSDTLVVILRPDQQDFQGTAVTVDIARQLDVPNLFLVVNKSLISPELKEYDQLVQKFRSDIEAKYGATVAGILPLTIDMANLGSADIFSLRYPDHVWSKELRKIAETVLAA